MSNASLRNLDSVPLDRASASLLDAARSLATGDPVWVRRKISELYILLQLCLVASHRLKLLFVDMQAEALRLMLALRCRVALQPRDAGPLRFAPDNTAVLGVTFPRDILLRNMPGTSFVTVLEPRDVFHPNVSAAHPHVMCLGATMPHGAISVNELVLLAYASLSLQAVTVDRYDPALVMNLEAAKWFEANPTAIPLTREPFMGEAAHTAVGGGI